MLMVVLRNFGGYDVRALLSMPFCHFKGLFDMAELAEQTEQYNNIIGASSGNTVAGKEIAESVESAKYVDAVKFRDMVTDRAKENAENILKGLKANG